MVGRRRRRARLLYALAGCGLVLVFGALVFYLFDRRLMLNTAARVFLDCVWLGVLVWVVVRRVWPAWRSRETEIDGALRLERQLGIDADLVAALEFDDAIQHQRADHFGSPQLACAVIDEVATAPPPIDVRREVRDAVTIGKPFIAASIAAGVIILLGGLYWRDAVTLVSRAFLSEAHYPSRTRLVRLTVAGREATVAPQSGPTRLVLPVGRPVEFELHVAGVVPETAVAELQSAGGGSLLDLRPTEGEPTKFSGGLPALVESLTGRITAGDAFSESFELVAAELPRVVVTLEVRQPEYAEEAQLAAPPPGRLNIAVLEAGGVGVVLNCVNKPLRRATLSLGGRTVNLTPNDDARRNFRLDPREVPELVSVRQPLEFQIQVEDEDGFALPEPLRGAIVLRPDQPPTVTAEVVTKYVLPAGKPTVTFQAADDLGIRSLAVTRQVVRADGLTAGDAIEIPLPEGQPATSPSGRFSVPLDGLQLVKGDKVTLRVEVRDRRQDAGRTPAQSEPFTLEVTDEQGLYEAMAETDQRSARKMDEIIQKQLMIGRGSTGSAAGPTSTVPPLPLVTPQPSSTAAPTPRPTGTASPTPPPPQPSSTPAPSSSPQ